MDTNGIYNDLTVEEQELLVKLQSKLQDKVNSIVSSKYDDIDNDAPLDLSKQHPEIIEPIHITNSPHEIRVSLSIEVSEVDDKGYLKETKELMKKNYHIPVPAKQDYSIYVNKFVTNLENKMADSCRESMPNKEYNE